MFFVEGVRNVVHAIESGFHIETLVYSEKLLIVPIARRLIRDRRRSGTPTLEVSPESFRQISTTPSRLRRGGHRRPAVVAAARRFAEGRALLGLLEAVRSEGNLGSLIRTSEAVGGAGFILVGSADRPLRPRGRPRLDGGVSSGSRSSGRTTAASGTGSAATVVASSAPRPTGSADLHRFDYPRPTILVLGEERQGLSPLQRGLCPDLVRIPMVGSADSLNLAVAGSLLMYEVYRTRSARRDRPPPPPLNGPGRKNSRPPAC